MPHIRITTERTGTARAAVLLDERIATNDLTSDRVAAALIARIGWGVSSDTLCNTAAVSPWKGGRPVHRA